MFLHIGNNRYILKKDIIAILDKSSFSSKEMEGFIDNLIEKDCSVNWNLDDIKTYILAYSSNKSATNSRGCKRECILYPSTISSNTLCKRNK